MGTFALFLLPRLSGWSALASRYRTEMEPPKPIQRVGGASIGIVSYNNVLKIAGIDQGLYLRISFPFGIFSPPLLIPWAEIRKRTRSRSLFMSWDALEIGERSVCIRLASKYLQPFEQYLPVLP